MGKVGSHQTVHVVRRAVEQVAFRYSRVSFQDSLFVVFQMNDQLCFRFAHETSTELTDAFTSRPSVNDIWRVFPGENAAVLRNLVEGGHCKPNVAVKRNGF